MLDVAIMLHLKIYSVYKTHFSAYRSHGNSSYKAAGTQKSGNSFRVLLQYGYGCSVSVFRSVPLKCLHMLRLNLGCSNSVSNKGSSLTNLLRHFLYPAYGEEAISTGTVSRGLAISNVICRKMQTTLYRRKYCTDYGTVGRDYCV